MDLENANNTSSIDIVKYESFDKMIEYLNEENIRNLAIESDLTANVYQKFEDFNLQPETMSFLGAKCRGFTST